MRKFRSITSASDANLYIGPFGEIVVDDSGQLRIQDNVTAGGHLVIADTGNIAFVNSTISTTDVASNIVINSNRLTVTNAIGIGNLVISNNNLYASSNVLSVAAGDHSFVFRDVSEGFNQGTGAIFKFDNIQNSNGPTFETWYGEVGNPFDPPGQHSLDIRASSNAAVNYIELASHDWNNYVGLNSEVVFINTNWNVDPEQFWSFDKFGTFVVTKQGLIGSHYGSSGIYLKDSNVEIFSTNQNNNLQFGLFIEDGDFRFGGNIVPSSNVMYDLGTPENQWRHLYVSSDTIYIGGTPLTVTNGELTVDGNPIAGGTSVPYLTVTNKAIVIPAISAADETEFVAVEGSGAVDNIDTGIGLSRGFGTDAKLFNVYSDYPSPEGTEWNSDGWDNLTDLNLREYYSFSWATGFRIGNQVLTKNYIMRDVANSTYYKINFTAWGQNSNGTFSYVRQQVDPVTGEDIGLPVTFEKTVNDNSFDDVSAQVHITRGGGGGIWNAVTETGWQDFYYNNRDVAPRGTAWNSDGWGNLLDYKTREYIPFADVYNNVNNIVGAELVMHDTVNDNYYKITFSDWITDGNAFSYTRWLISDPAIFVKEDYGDQVDVFIPDDGEGAGIGITRDNNGGIYNPYREGEWDSDISPAGTVWNIDGWSDLNNVTTRTYTNFYAAFGNGGLGNKVVGTECIMHIPENNTYYAIKFTSWTQNNNGGGFAYERYTIDTSKLPEGIAFPDGTVQKTAYTGGRVKSTASGGRRIEEVTGDNTVSVTEVTAGIIQTATIRQTSNSWDFYVNADSNLTQLYDNQNSFNYLEFSFDGGNSWIPVTFGGGSYNVYYQMVFEDNVDRPVTENDVVSYRTVSGGDPVVWWDYTTLPGGSAGFRGAIIDYHAFSGEATIIGTIHIARDSGDDHITHTETASGSTDSENDDLWNVVTEGKIRYRRMDGEAKTLKVQWIAKVFYGDEFWD
jgi:hypothetical protein